MTPRRRRRSYGLSFSWKRALGVSAAKGRISRAIGVPLTRQGRQRKFGRAMGCVWVFLPLAAALGLAAARIVA